MFRKASIENLKVPIKLSLVDPGMDKEGDFYFGQHAPPGYTETLASYRQYMYVYKYRKYDGAKTTLSL